MYITLNIIHIILIFSIGFILGSFVYSLWIKPFMKNPN